MIHQQPLLSELCATHSRSVVVGLAAACYPECLFRVDAASSSAGGRKGKKLVALTIDDSPGACTDELLSILRVRLQRDTRCCSRYVR